MDRKTHWDGIYKTQRTTEASWYQAEPTRSLELLRQTGAGAETTIIDIGGGDSTLVDAVVAEGLGRMTVLDISEAALTRARARLGERAREVTWIEADVTRTELPPQAFDVWHDRAVYHFLTEPADRARYQEAAAATVRRGGTLLMATFAPEGPTHCSGLSVARYSVGDLARDFSHAFALTRGFADVHRTPAGIEQHFSVAVFRRL
jgi:SAM-dependent methyltransferase